ncbi:MAG TPA: hypothetical protein VJP80_05690 [Candidatus Saccharimonadales bacterium]|nr:hypothetical protein [Candidatus Saccharimonadales bacterium]
MNLHHIKLKGKTREWLNRYILAEILGTIGALIAAWAVYSHTHSYIAAAASGWIGEGIGFYGYFVTIELLRNSRKYREYPPAKRVSSAIAAASTNLLVEFLPAEILDNFIIRPYLMYVVPRYIHPYPIGFLAGKFSADILFYVLAILGYEARKHWLHR